MRIRKLIKSERGILEPALSEEDVLGQVRQLLEINGARVQRIRERIPYRDLTCSRCGHKSSQRIGKASERGICDLMGRFRQGSEIHLTHGPSPFWLECKRPGGRWSSPEQQWEIEEMQKDGLIAGRVESWKDTIDLFAKFGIEFKVG